MRDHAFDFEEPVPAGRVVFSFTNEGSVDHRASIVVLPHDVPPILEQLRGDERRAVQPVAGFPARKPGDRGLFAADLEPDQRYGLVCLLEDDDGVPYAVKGMALEFRTAGPPDEEPGGTPGRDDRDEGRET